MMEENLPRVSPIESEDSSATKKRRKRKWDQPAELLVSAGVALPGIFPVGSLTPPVVLSDVASSPGAVLANSIGTTVPSLFQVPFVNPHVASAVPKINQPKIQDELIAREIVINDADSSIRYKLTKRQTQEEIQRCTGAVVITRGKYHPPNAPSDSEKPLYLHISAGAHLETTVERIKAVDLAAAMVEDMLKQHSGTNGGMVVHPFSTSVYLGFEPDPSLNIAARIRGPNDQYINHIVNETGATVILRGHGSGNSDCSFDEERQQPLHLFLTSNNPRILESAKLLAENLLDTISREFGASRIPSYNAYGAGNEVALNNNLPTSVLTSAVNTATIPLVSSTVHVGIMPALLQGTLVQSTVGGSVPQPNLGCYPQQSLTSGTSYHGYGGIYPRATPLQQVALALGQSPSFISSTAAPIIPATSTAANSSETLSSEKEKRRRKFQELPVPSSGCAKTHQDDARFLKPGEEKQSLKVRNLSSMPAPKKLVDSSISGMPPPPPKSMPPPPPPKFDSSVPAPKISKNNNVVEKSKQESIPDTLIKLMEYGDEEDDDDDDDETTEVTYKRDTNGSAASKPFWAV